MANVFPTLSSGSMRVSPTLATNAMVQYPLTLVNSYVVRVIQFLDDSEQRFVVRGPLFGATLEFHGLNGADLSVLREFFYEMRGGYVDAALVNTFSIKLAGITYNYCIFDTDDFAVQTDRAENSSVSLKVMQVRPN